MLNRISIVAMMIEMIFLIYCIAYVSVIIGIVIPIV